MKYLTIALYCIIFSTDCIAWGQTGHRVVGQIAQNNLSNKVKKKIESILDGQSMAMVSNFMDQLKSDPAYDSLKPWHYCTIPNESVYEEAPKKGDIIKAINSYISLLKSDHLQKEEEIFSLKCLIHLIGDIHQPLHVGNGKDKGGNEVRVTYFYKSSNLHRVWDSGIIDGQKLSYTEYVHWIDKPTNAQIIQWKNDDLMTWVKESISYRPQIYDLPKGHKIKYNYNNIQTVNLRLLQAGIRLAGVLEDIYQ